VQAQDELRRTEAQFRAVGFAQLALQAVQAREERFNLRIELTARRRQAKRRSLEEPYANVRLERGNLPADGRLLDTVRDMSDRGADAPVLGDVIE
jgi:hypothetical protein